MRIAYKQAELAYLTMTVKFLNHKLEKRFYRIDFIKNPRLEEEFENTKAEFLSSGISYSEQLMFHGTHRNSIDGILANNFEQSAVPLQRSKVRVICCDRHIKRETDGQINRAN
jgi:hypothetical protein